MQQDAPDLSLKQKVKIFFILAFFFGLMLWFNPPQTRLPIEKIPITVVWENGYSCFFYLEQVIFDDDKITVYPNCYFNKTFNRNSAEMTLEKEFGNG
jgi:hypothetical protein